jgi:hypothetical protein
MALVLQLTPRAQQRLEELAQREGKAPEAFALETLECWLAEAAETLPLPRHEWLDLLNSFAKTLPPGNPNASFDRDTIYEGRGE